MYKNIRNTLRIEGHIPVLLDAGKRYLGRKLKAYTQNVLRDNENFVLYKILNFTKIIL